MEPVFSVPLWGVAATTVTTPPLSIRPGGGSVCCCGSYVPSSLRRVSMLTGLLTVRRTGGLAFGALLFVRFKCAIQTPMLGRN